MSDISACPLCKLEPPDFRVVDDTIDYGERITCECQRCGEFLISKTAIAEARMQSRNTIAKLSSWIRLQNELHKSMPRIIVSDGSLHNIMENLKEYSPSEKQTMLLEAFIRKSEYPGKSVLFVPRFDYPLSFSVNEEELIFHVNVLLDKKLIECSDGDRISKDVLATEIVVTNKGYDFSKIDQSHNVALINKDTTFKQNIDRENNQDLQWDVFISHASEDKKDVVDPLARELTGRGIKVWYDEWVLKIGDSLLEEINQGLLKSRYGIVVLSSNFLRKKQWTKNELDGLMQKEINGKKVILPIWHNLNRDEVASYSPILAGRLAGSTANMKKLVDDLMAAMADIPANTDTVDVPDTYETIVEYKKIKITGEIHRYSLIFRIKLNIPPAKNNYLVRLLWPSFITIVNKRDFSSIREVVKDRQKYVELSYQCERRLYPEDTINIVAPGGQTELEYEFDHNIWSKVEHGKHELLWEIFSDDQAPVKGRIDFRKLNFF